MTFLSAYVRERVCLCLCFIGRLERWKKKNNRKPWKTYLNPVLSKSRACLKFSLVSSPTICFQDHPFFQLLCLMVHTSHIIHRCKTSAKLTYIWSANVISEQIDQLNLSIVTLKYLTWFLVNFLVIFSKSIKLVL